MHQKFHFGTIGYQSSSMYGDFLASQTNIMYNTNSFLYQRHLAKILREKANIADCDMIVVVAYSVIVAALPHVRKPIVYFTDATYSALENYYPEVSHLFKFSSRQANAICKTA